MVSDYKSQTFKTTKMSDNAVLDFLNCFYKLCLEHWQLALWNPPPADKFCTKIIGQDIVKRNLKN